MLKNYILKISNKAFVITEPNGDVTIVSDPNRATEFEKIGDAMKAASLVNEILEANIVKVIS